MDDYLFLRKDRKSAEFTGKILSKVFIVVLAIWAIKEAYLWISSALERLF